MSIPAKIHRRQILQAGGATGALALAGASLGCSRTRGRPSGAEQNVLKVFNWSDYIAEGLIPEFERRHHCHVIYDNYSSDAELEARLATGGGAYDVVFPSDRAMYALLAKGLLQPLDRARLPNSVHLDEKFLNPPFDPSNQFSAPYFWGTVAIGVRGDHVPAPVKGFEVLFDRRFKGRITMLDDLESVVGALLLHLGLPLNSVDPNHLEQVKRLLLAQRPLVQAYTSDAYKERLIAGDAWISLGWSGDLLQAAGECPEVQVVVPERGTIIWLDSMAIPKAASNAALAHQFINFLLDPGVAARNAEYVQYGTPNLAAFGRLSAESRQNATTYPSERTLERCQWLTNRGADIARIEAIWREVRA